MHAMRLSHRTRHYLGAAIAAAIVTLLAYPSVLRLEQGKQSGECPIRVEAQWCS